MLSRLRNFSIFLCQVITSVQRQKRSEAIGITGLSIGRKLFRFFVNTEIGTAPFSFDLATDVAERTFSQLCIIIKTSIFR